MAPSATFVPVTTVPEIAPVDVGVAVGVGVPALTTIVVDFVDELPSASGLSVNDAVTVSPDED